MCSAWVICDCSPWAVLLSGNPSDTAKEPLPGNCTLVELCFLFCGHGQDSINHASHTSFLCTTTLTTEGKPLQRLLALCVATQKLLLQDAVSTQDGYFLCPRSFFASAVATAERNQLQTSAFHVT